MSNIDKLREYSSIVILLHSMYIVPTLCSKDYKSNINCGNTLPYKGNLSRKSSFTKVRQKSYWTLDHKSL